MKEIPLTQGKAAIVDDEDYEKLSAFKWFALRHVLRSGEVVWYAARWLPRQPGEKRKCARLHRVIVNAPDDVDVDHKNGNGLDCTRLNLRQASTQNNCRNRQHARAGKTSRFTGVWLRKATGRWHTAIRAGNPLRQIHLGSFRSEEEAGAARRAAELVHYGEYAP